MQRARSTSLLLDAAARAIQGHGIKGTTVDAIQRYSGLSRGMIKQRFGSKDALIWAVAEKMMQEYTDSWMRAFQGQHASAGEKLAALFKADLSENVLNERNVAIWFAFRSEVASTHKYRQLIEAGDAQFQSAIKELCDELAVDEHTATLAAMSLSAILEGLWTKYLLEGPQFNRDKAYQACCETARGFFPGCILMCKSDVY
ncbi:TetR/AcrR family transcriptional regulator [Thioclava sp.]|uniref:TetR/AcrR family transcriptional regulator n=1 Tax=Thioclava sp. TaxID=1933450 RepID=UPI003AA7AE9C